MRIDFLEHGRRAKIRNQARLLSCALGARKAVIARTVLCDRIDGDSVEIVLLQFILILETGDFVGKVFVDKRFC